MRKPVFSTLSVHLRPSTKIDITVRRVDGVAWLKLDFGESEIAVFYEDTNRQELVSQLRAAARAIEKKAATGKAATV